MPCEHIPFSQFGSQHEALKEFFFVCKALKSPLFPRILPYVKSTVCKVSTLFKRVATLSLYITTIISSRNKLGASQHRLNLLPQSTEETELKYLSQSWIIHGAWPPFLFLAIWLHLFQIVSPPHPIKHLIWYRSPLLSVAITWHFPEALFWCCCLIIIHFLVTPHSRLSSNRAATMSHSPSKCPGLFTIPGML